MKNDPERRLQDLADIDKLMKLPGVGTGWSARS